MIAKIKTSAFENKCPSKREGSQWMAHASAVGSGSEPLTSYRLYAVKKMLLRKGQTPHLPCIVYITRKGLFKLSIGCGVRP